MAPLTRAQISIDRWSKLLLIGSVLLVVVSGHASMSCGGAGDRQRGQIERRTAAMNAGTFDVEIRPARLAGPKVPEAPRAAAIPLELPQQGAGNGAADKPEPRLRMPRRVFQQPEQQPEQFPVIVDGLEQPVADAIPFDQPVVNPIPIIDQPLVDPMPVDFVGNDAVEQPARGHDHHHRGFGGKKGRCCCAQRRLSGVGLATGVTGVVAAFRPSRCGVALFLVGVLVVEILTLLRVSTKVIHNVSQCMDSARTVGEVNACGDFGRRAGAVGALIVGVVATSLATCGACLNKGVMARAHEERVEAEAAAMPSLPVRRCRSSSARATSRRCPRTCWPLMAPRVSIRQMTAMHSSSGREARHSACIRYR
jgi:hypothetical protein